MKKLYIKTLGCAMNVRDSEHMIAELRSRRDYEMTDSPEEADLILINTCSVREKPVQKLFSEIGQFERARKPDAKIGVCGCTASHMGGEILKRAPAVDFVLGARNVSKISEIIDQPKAVEIAIDHDESTYMFATNRTDSCKALINISIGCDKKCAYCIVPATRGEEISIPPDLIVQEVEKAASEDVKEVWLLGQNVNNYGRRFSGYAGKCDFTELLQKVSDVAGIERIRFTSPHPLHMDDLFLQEFATNPKICKHIHMPLQSGSTELLQKMRRGYTQEWFLERAHKIRSLVPDVAIGTDIIVGFPGESEQDFEATMKVLEQVRFEQVFSFKYSPRPHTEALNFGDAVPDSVASERLIRLQDRHKVLLDEIASEQLGHHMEVLFDSLNDEGCIEGRSSQNRIIKTRSQDQSLLGTIRSVNIIEAGRLSSVGEIL